MRDAHSNANHSHVPSSSVSVGDVVVVHEEGLPQRFWKLGKIEEVIPGRDGKVRCVTVLWIWDSATTDPVIVPIRSTQW